MIQKTTYLLNFFENSGASFTKFSNDTSRNVQQEIKFRFPIVVFLSRCF